MRKELGGMEHFEGVLADARGFFKSRVILTAADLDLFTELEKTPASAKELVEKMDSEERATTRLLDCLVTFDLLEKRNGKYHVTERGSCLSARHPKSVLPMVLHYDHLWHNWSLLTQKVQTGETLGREPIIEAGDERQRAFIGAMHVVGREVSVEIADDYDLTPYKKLLDVGGASGTYAIAFLKKNTNMGAVIFDFENVLEMAKDRIESEGLKDRVEFVSGDFYEDEFPNGCDLALLSAIIHQNSPEENLKLYKKVFGALEPNGKILIRDHIMDESRTKPPAGALFALNMLVNTRGGDTYTYSEVEKTLKGAGFVDIKQVRSGPKMDCLVEGGKPA